MRKRHTTIAVLVAVAICAALAGRVLWSGRTALAEGEELAAAGLDEAAIEAYGRAARWYLPLLGPHGRARDALLEMGRVAEGQGRVRDAVRCYSEVRGSVLGTRSPLGVDEERLEKADAGLARSLAKWSAEEGRPYGEAVFAGSLARDESPDPWISLLCVVLFVVWIGVTVAGLMRSVTPRGVVSWKRLGLTAIVSLVLLAAWLAALRVA